MDIGTHLIPGAGGGPRLPPALAKWVFPPELDLSVLGKPLLSAGPPRSRGEASLPRGRTSNTPPRLQGEWLLRGRSLTSSYERKPQTEREPGNPHLCWERREDGAGRAAGELGEGKKSLQKFIPWNLAKPSAPCWLKLWCQRENLRVKQLPHFPSPLLF